MFMSQLQEFLELKERVYAMRREAAERQPTGQSAKKARKTKVKPAAATSLAQLDHAIARIEAGLYPLCETCGARIEMDRLRETPEITTCLSCDAASRRKQA